jgi:hypothetical protein
MYGFGLKVNGEIARNAGHEKEGRYDASNWSF